MAPQADALAADATTDSVAWVAPTAAAAEIAFFGESPPAVFPLG
jgi:hypothetical protein